MNYSELVDQIKKKQSFLCVGLDTDIKKIPEYLSFNEDPVFEFNKIIIDSTHEFAVAYKPNIAFYEANGIEGWQSLAKTVEYIRTRYPDLFLIADAKRGDIGNTSSMYARAFFEKMDFDAITVAPYMGSDSVLPFMDYPEKWVILLALTSNQGAFDFQFFESNAGEKLYEKVIDDSKKWGKSENMMYVVGATKAEMLNKIRKQLPDHFLLVPGVGAQGGSLQDVVENGINKNCGLLVNSSRGIIYAANDITFDIAAKDAAHEIQKEMAALLHKHKVL